MKSFYVIPLFLGLPLGLLAQTSTQNYTVTTVPYQAVSDPTALTDINSNSTIQYFDGLGRPVETVQKAITPTGKDLVSGIEYDSFGHDYRHLIPKEVSGISGAYIPGFSSEYATTEYEPSPLNRVTGQYGAGGEWYSAGKKKAIDYTTNGSDVKHFYVDGTQIKCDGSYADATLYGQKITDEDGKTTEQFTDKLGRKVLSRMAGDHDTYYVYDDLDNLRYVLPPLAADAMGTNTNGFDESANSTLGLYGYIYHYDGRKRCTEKKLPGCDWIYMVYDRADRLILSQDGNQRAKLPTKWTVTKYDILGRVLYTGLINSTNNRATMDSTYSGSVTPESYTGSGVVAGYTSSNLTPVTVLIVNYYDNYGFLTYSGNNPSIMLSPVTLNGYDTPDLVHTKTLLTGTRVYHLDNPALYEVIANYYDKYGRMVQTRATNHLGGYDITYNALDFTGKPGKTYKTHGINGASATITELYTYTYDKGQRLDTTTHSLNGATRVILAVNYYDALGRLSAKSLHNSAETTYYRYNIRNWITNINNGSWWKEEILYQDAPTNPLYNGNIAQITWMYNRRPNKGYKYTYDNLNRLTQANYGERTGLHASQHLYDEYFGYDKMGNITSIQRNGGLNNKLNLHYNGNQLQTGDVSSSSYSLYNLTEYTNYSTNVASDHLYDANGNMTQDLDKNIVAIQYNVLNLPDIIQFKNGNQVINTYNANGQKLRTKYYTAITPVIVPVGTIHDGYSANDATLSLDDYLGSVLYERGTAEDAVHHPLTKVMTPEGYVDYATGGKPYCYFRKDHLGSIREVDTYQGPITVLQKTQYYPSGTPFQDSFASGEQAYKFTGKEMITMHGLNWQDFGARWLDNVRLQFTSMDPLAEKYYSISPYAYCAGNPVNRIDPDGMDWGVTIGQGDGDNPPMVIPNKTTEAIDNTAKNDNTANKIPMKMKPIQGPPDLALKEALKTEKSTDKNAQLSQTDKMIVTPEDKAVSGNPVVQATVLGVTSAIVAPAIIAAADNVAVAVQGSKFLLPVLAGAGAVEGLVKAKVEGPPDLPYFSENPVFKLSSDLFSNGKTLYTLYKNERK